jgi:predicted dehydrogenase
VLGSARIVETGLAPAIARDPRSVLAAVASRSTADASAFAGRLGASRAYGSYDELLHDEGVDIVYVPLPNSLHRQWAIAALEAGKHVLVEKPLALTGADARAMADAARAADRLLLEGFMWRYHPRVERIREIVRDELGPLRLVRIAYTYDLAAGYGGDPDAAARDIRYDAGLGGGALGDIGSYTVSGLRTYAGGHPERVTGRLLSEGRGVDLRFSGEILFDDGVLGQFFVAMDVPGGALLDLQGDRGRLRMTNAFRTAAEWGDPVIEVMPFSGPARRETVPFADQFDLEVQAVAAVLLDGADPLITLEDSIENADTLDAIRRSWSEHTVDMPHSGAEGNTR